MKSIENKKGITLEFTPEFEKLCKKYYNKKDNEILTENEMFHYFHDVYMSALKKGYYES